MTIADKIAALSVSNPSLAATGPINWAKWIENHPDLLQKLHHYGNAMVVPSKPIENTRVSLSTETQLQRATALLNAITSVRSESFALEAAWFASKQTQKGLKEEVSELQQRHADEKKRGVEKTLEEAVASANDKVKKVQALQAEVKERTKKFYGDDRAKYVASQTDLASKSAGAASYVAGWDLDHLAALANEQAGQLDLQLIDAQATATTAQRALVNYQLSQARDQRRIKFLNGMIADYDEHASSTDQAFEPRVTALAVRLTQLVGELTSTYQTLMVSAALVFECSLSPIDLRDAMTKPPTIEAKLAEMHEQLTKLAAHVDARMARSYEVDVRIPVVLHGRTTVSLPPELAENRTLRLRGVTAEFPDLAGDILKLYFPDVFTPSVPLFVNDTPPKINPLPLVLTVRHDPPREEQHYQAARVLWNHSGKGSFYLSPDEGIIDKSCEGALWFRCAMDVEASGITPNPAT